MSKRIKVELKNDFSGWLDSDSAPQTIAPTSYINLQNMRFGTTDKGRTKQLESVGATVQVANPYLPATSPYGISVTIGSVEDKAKQRTIEFSWNETGYHGIYCYDGTTYYKVLLDAQTESGLGFQKDSLIDARIQGNLLIYNDGVGEPKCINIEAGIKLNHSGYSTTEAAYATPVKYTTSTLIKRPPIFPVVISKFYESAYKNNFIADNAFQFTYRFRYRDNQTSALASFSHLSPYNFKADTYNRIDVTVSLLEYIDDDIFAIDLCVRFGNTGKTFIVKTWDKDSDAAAITAHNSGTALSYLFYNDSTGEALDDVTAATSFHGVPMTTQTFELAKNRLYLFNNLLGYDTPVSTSLAVTLGTLDTGGAGTYTANWKYVNLTYLLGPSGMTSTEVKSFYYAYNASLSPNIVYYYSGSQTYSPPASLNTVDADVALSSESALANWIFNNVAPPLSGTWDTSVAPVISDTGSTMSLILTVPSTSLRFFKSNSTYKVSIAFYDRYKRRCGVVKNYATATIPIRTYNQTVFNSIIQWTLSNTNAVNEIPDWAYYYVIQITKNQTTSFFEQINASKTSYVTKDDAGAYTILQEAFVANKYYATAFDLSQLIAAGLGYTFTAGDLLIVYKTDGTSVTVPILETYGNYVFVQPTNLGDLTSSPSNIIELYTPYKPSTNEFFYETAGMYTILNPTTSSRQYATLSDQINGDCYAIERDRGSSSLYFCETMSPNDKFWQIWEKDIGWVNAVDKIGQTDVKGSLVYSDTYLEGTKVNGFNVFQPTSYEIIPAENGAVRKVMLASKTQAEGNVLVCICEDETLAIYLGEAVLTSAVGTATAIATSNGVIGTINPLKGGRGTTNPESVVQFRGNVYWYDARHGDFVFYASNGIHSATEGRIYRFAKLYSDKFKSLTQSEIEALGNRPFVIGGVDEYHKEILWSIPKVGSNPNTALDTGAEYPFDFNDYEGKTVVFKLGAMGREGLFMGSLSCNAESFVSIGNALYSYKGGSLWLHNQTSAFASFYGVNYYPRVMFCVNEDPSHPKIITNVVAESNLKPDYSYIITEYPNVQGSDLVTGDFKYYEGIFYGGVYRDRLSPNASGTNDEKLYTGDKLRGTYAYVLLEWHNNATQVQLKAADVIFDISSGHQV